uniref:(northern house mosquito) hypothetical protein n=1 Tax=Culex pipiens TaxID=7175 RepID=A0A8D8KFG8_CULPI
MQHASFLHCQRTLRGLRATVPPSTSGYQISSLKIIRNAPATHPVLPSRSKKSRPRSLRPDMSALFQAGHAGHRAVRAGRAHRWRVPLCRSREQTVQVRSEKLALVAHTRPRRKRETSPGATLPRAVLHREPVDAAR